MADLKTAGIADNLIFDNVGETPGQADQPSRCELVIHDASDTLACEGIEDLRGSIQVNCCTPKNRGSKPG